jgi:hypothetical protein
MDAKSPDAPAYGETNVRVDSLYEIHKLNKDRPAFELVDGGLVLRAELVNGDDAYSADGLFAALPDLVAGHDYVIQFHLDDKTLQIVEATDDAVGDPLTIGGFHFAPGGNAMARAGGDSTPAINPFSIWDLEFRPACPDPRGMAYIEGAHVPFWCDIYLLGCNPWRDGTSKFGVYIADGVDLPCVEDDETPVEELDYASAVRIYAAFGKTLLGPEDFFEAMLGVTESTSLERDPNMTGLDAPRTSRYGIMQATGNMSTWGHNGDHDPAHRKAAHFGGDWYVGDWAGSRCASVPSWPGYSNEWLGARGRSDHLQPDA